MKKQIFAIIFAVGILGAASAITHAQSQAFKIDVPFEFTARDKTLPAGTYVVGPASDNRTVWKLQNADQKSETFLLVGSLSSSNDVGNVLLTFRRYGDRSFLIGFKSNSYQVKLPTSGSEKSFRKTQNNLAKNDPAIVEAVSGK